MNDIVGKIERLDTKIRKGCCDVDPTDAIDNCKHDIKKLEQENKSLRDDVNYLREKVLEKNEETFKERFTLKQKMHICQMIEEWDEESRKDNWKNSLENLKCMICDTSIGETQ